MSRTISAATQGKLDATAWQPGFLIDMKVSPSPLRFSTRGIQTVDGIVYVPAVVDVAGLVDDSSGGTLTFRDPSLALQTLIRTTSLTARRISIARFYEGATGSTDPIWFFDGAIQSAAEDAPPSVVVQLSRTPATRGLTPPRRINRSSGFNVLCPEGQIVRFRDSTFRLGRARV